MPMDFIEAPSNFYLGAKEGPNGQREPLYYDSRDLMTHGVILGMTGSGKTGLGITILEEAVVDGIPCLIIDPKGDITNMLLAFSDLSAESFKPWINPEDAVRADATLDEHAESIATKWREGLAEWGIDNDRIQEYRRAARFSIYTPGSEAGLRISILQSLAAPKSGWEGHEEVLRERISSTVTAILALIGISAKPVEDREHILLSNIFEYNWRNNVDLSMEQLILQVQRPPFEKLGVLDVETIFPEKDRFKLAHQLNNIIAAPNFQNWIQGEAIDIASLLYTPDGYPRTTIFYIAHLNESERQFILTLLLENIHSWIRTLDGSSSLRALLYMDEVYGLFPPHPYNPPTKDPILRLLKQARAYGVGVILATQNPKDIDYKGLSNAGTWIIGKLQTDNDKERVLEGLDSARDATSTLDMEKVDQLLGQLEPRQFILHNVHDPETPTLMTTRWAMSYLRGPLTRQHISQLMANQREYFEKPKAKHQEASSGVGVSAPVVSRAAPSLNYPPPGSQVASDTPGSAADAAPSTYSEPSDVQLVSVAESKEEEDPPPSGFSALPPGLPSSIAQFYLPTEYTLEQAAHNWGTWMQQPVVDVKSRNRLLYRPSLLAQTQVRFEHKPTASSELWTYAFVVPDIPKIAFVNWLEYVSDPFDPHALETQPHKDAFYAEIPHPMNTASGFKELRASLEDWIYREAAVYVYYNPVLKTYSKIGEDKRDFYAKLQAIARQERDEEVDTVASRYDKKLEALEARARKKQMRLETTRDELDARKREELLTAGESALQLLKGRAYYTLSRTSRMRRYTNTSENRVDLAERELVEIAEGLEQTEYEMQQALQEVSEKWSNALQQVEEVRVSPYKKDIHMVVFGIGWIPYWEATINNLPSIIPATSSGLAYAQEPMSSY